MEQLIILLIIYYSLSSHMVYKPRLLSYEINIFVYLTLSILSFRKHKYGYFKTDFLFHKQFAIKLIQQELI